MLENDPAGTQSSLITVSTATGARSQLGERYYRVNHVVNSFLRCQPGAISTRSVTWLTA
jgi:hypothetical protein